jgi:Polyketide cyclase / dehydrase and lipid transport
MRALETLTVVPEHQRAGRHQLITERRSVLKAARQDHRNRVARVPFLECRILWAGCAEYVGNRPPGAARDDAGQRSARRALFSPARQRALQFERNFCQDRSSARTLQTSVTRRCRQHLSGSKSTAAEPKKRFSRVARGGLAEGGTMASIRKEIEIDAPAEDVWAAIRDIGAIHTRLAEGFVLNTKLDGDSRLVTFANGEVVRERIVDVDDQARRLAYAVVDWRTSHHNASFQVLPDGSERCRLVWITDLLPNTLAELVGSFIEQGCTAMKRTLEARSVGSEG